MSVMLTNPQTNSSITNTEIAFKSDELILHGSAKTTHAVRATIQRSKASIQELASRYDLNPKTVMKWRKHAFLYDAPMGLLALDDCLYALQATIPHLTRSSLHRLFQRHEISRLPAIEGETGRKKAFKRYPIGYFHIDIAEVRTEKANFTCLSRLTAHRSLLSLNSTRRLTDIRQRPS